MLIFNIAMQINVYLESSQKIKVEKYVLYSTVSSL